MMTTTRINASADDIAKMIERDLLATDFRIRDFMLRDRIDAYCDDPATTPQDRNAIFMRLLRILPDRDLILA